MKKTMVFLVVLSLALAGMVASGSALEAADVVGTWYLNGVEMNGAAVNPATLGLEMTLTLNEDGTASMEMMGEVDDSGTWKLEGDTVSIGDAASMMSFTVADGVMTGEIQPGMTAIFGQEQGGADAFVPTPAVAAADLAAFDGAWVATQFVSGEMAVPIQMTGMELYADIAEGNVALRVVAATGEASSEVSCTLVDGTLTGTRINNDVEETVVFELHEDGTLSVSIEPTNNGALVFFEPAAAEAASAA